MSCELTFRMNGQVEACKCGLFFLLLVSSLNCVLCKEHKSYRHVPVTFPTAVSYEFQMKHRDYHKFPFNVSTSGSSSLRARYTNAAKRSRDRAKYIMKQLRHSDDLNPSAHPDAVSPVFSQLGEYITSISIGTPAKSFITIVDTGSDLVWVQCTPCPNCFHQPDPLFDPTKSSTYVKVNCNNSLCSNLLLPSCQRNVCQYSYGYGDGSYTEGDLSTETVTLTNTNGTAELVPSFTFGCGTANGGDFSESDGILGLGWGSLSMMTQLATTLGDKFSYCLVTFMDAVTKTSPLIFGRAQPTEAGIRWTPLIRNENAASFYYVGIEDMSINGERLNISKSAFEIDQYGNGGTILDTGTTLYFLESEAYESVEAGLKQLIEYQLIEESVSGLELCYNVSKVKNPSFPNITIHFTGADFLVPQNNAFVLVDDQGTTCLTAVPTLGFSIFGNLLQQNFLFVFDRVNERLGFVPKQCS